jgi:hypothetical protein
MIHIACGQQMWPAHGSTGSKDWRGDGAGGHGLAQPSGRQWRQACGAHRLHAGAGLGGVQRPLPRHMLSMHAWVPSARLLSTDPACRPGRTSWRALEMQQPPVQSYRNCSWQRTSLTVSTRTVLCTCARSWRPDHASDMPPLPGAGSGTVMLAHDTRPSATALMQAAVNGVTALGGMPVACGLLTTPQLHWMVGAAWSQRTGVSMQKWRMTTPT